MRVLYALIVGSADQHSSGHPEMYDPLPSRTSVSVGQIADDVLADAPELRNPRSLEHFRDGSCRRFQQVRLVPDPDFLDLVPGSSLIEPARDCFYFRKFRHWS